MSEVLQPKPFCGPQPKVIRFPSTTGMGVDRTLDEVGPFTKSNMDAVKILKVMRNIRPFSGRSREEIMEFICYMYEVQGKPGHEICKITDRNSTFYVVVSGELLHTRPTNNHHRQQPREQKLYEQDYWGLECLFTGKHERVSVTVTSQCRLFALRAKRFVWICKMAAKRTFYLETKIMENLLKELPCVQKYLGKRTEGLPDQDVMPSQLSKINVALRSRMLDAFRQVEVPSCKLSLPPIEIFSSSGEFVIVYVLTGSVKLTLERCANFRGQDPESNVTLKAGEFQEIGANQEWFLRQSCNQKSQPTIVYLITLRQAERNSDSMFP